MNGILYDLSPVIDGGTPVWPGDEPFSMRWNARLSAESPINLSSFSATVHLGSHADAPLHTERDGRPIDTTPLEAYIGPCLVIEPSGCLDGLMLVEHLATDLAFGAPLDPPRLLLKTGTADYSKGFPQHFAALSPQLALALAQSGASLIGTDAPSIDPFDSRELPAHHALLGMGVAVVEGLRLSAVPPGLYELIALPLRLRGLDASPVRAVLREWRGDNGATAAG